MKKQIAMLGGCFNPPLNSHFWIAQQMLNEYSEIEKIIFMPVNNIYPKNGLVNKEYRYNMLKLICDKNEKMEVSRIELDSTRQLDTVETLNILQNQYPDHEITFITRK